MENTREENDDRTERHIQTSERRETFSLQQSNRQETTTDTLFERIWQEQKAYGEQKRCKG